MSSPATRCAVLGTAIVAAFSTTAALAATQQTYSQKFTTSHPSRNTGMTFTAASTGTPPLQAKTVALTFPAGTKINTGAVPKCTTPKACPAKSLLGTGQATVLLGTAPITQKVAAYNRAGGMVLVVSAPPPTPPVVLTPALSGTRLTLQIPSLKFNGIPLVLTKLSLNIRQHGTGAKGYVRTPAVCPAGGSWTFGAVFTYLDRTTTTLTSQSRCSAH